ncbi:MAG: FAD-dependent oxidoreductase [Desulfonauticus sp.]|nr:FAD-dependent oxidoreductase [Desulfonauticus sp.]
MKYVIIGNGVSSIGAIEGIRKIDKQSEILVISEEGFLTYGRPLISYFLAGKVGDERLALRSSDFYSKNNVQTMLGSKVIEILPEEKKIVVKDKQEVSYDKLLIATGGTPFCPPIKGLEGDGIYFFTTLNHAKQLDAVCPKLKKVVVIGGGLIGLKAAESLFDRGVKVSIVELAPRVLSSAFDEVAGKIVANRLTSVGLSIFCGTTVKEIQRDDAGKVKGVFLENGTYLEVDAVIVAIGVVPNIELAQKAGLEINRGILVDKFLTTSKDDIFAAGDVAEAWDKLINDNRVIPIWPNAYAQGYAAGQNMAGAKREYEGGLPMNSIGFYGLPTISIGLVNPPEGKGFQIEMMVDEEREVYRKLVFKGDYLVGCVLVGDIDMAGRYAGYIRFQIPVKDLNLKNNLKQNKATYLDWPEEVFQQFWNKDARIR